MYKEKELFEFLVKDYGLKYSYQDFKNCYGGNWWIYTHSYYNDNGCFTIHNLAQRKELDFYYSKNFSTIREKLCEKLLDIQSIGQEAWAKVKNKILFGHSHKLILKTLAEIIKAEIEKNGEFFGIKIR